MPALSLLALVALFIATAHATGSFGKNVYAFLTQSFYFNWNDPTIALPNPTTAQCDTIHITWGRGDATGSNPIAPYKLVIVTSSQTVPYTVDAGMGLQYNLTVPFPPGTQYQICMFDKNGATGGCQDVYTMYPALSNSVANCANISLPTNTLDVNGVVENGPLSAWGWVPQCTDISLTPKNGTPPYNLLVLPALHPPYRITSNDMSAINWTVSLTWASSFFLVLTDANGASWSNGPIHSGAGVSDACLSSGSGGSGVSVGVAVGSSIGGLVFGAIVGLAIASFFVRNRYTKIRRNSSTDSIDQAAYISNQDRFKRSEGGPQAGSAHVTDVGTNQYLVEPFMPEPSGPTSPTQNSSTQPPAPTSAYSNTQSDGSGSNAQPTPHVYVVHHDGGGAPVTVFTGGAAVTELPPSYVGRSDDRPLPQQPGSSSSNSFDPADRRSRPGPTPRKPQPESR